MTSRRTIVKRELQVKQKDQPAPERKKWERITENHWATLESAYIHRENAPTYAELEKEFGIGIGTIELYGKENKWVSKRKLFWAKIQEKIRNKLGDKIAEMRAKNIMVAEGTQAYLMELLKARQLKGTVGDIDKIIRLIEFLYGNADSRPDGGIKFEDMIREIKETRRQAIRDKINNSADIIDVPIKEIEANANNDDVSQGVGGEGNGQGS